jgi:lysophospholipase L1-like esterase
MFDRVNELIAKLSDGETVFFRDHGPALLDADGRLTADVSPDGTHLTRLGYERWAAVLDDDLRKLMGY